MENYLIHRSHKYVKRERRGNRWKYWYDYDLTGNGYKRDSNAAWEKARNLYNDNEHLKTNSKLGYDKSYYVHYRDEDSSPNSGRIHDIGNTNAVAEANSKYVKSQLAKADVEWARYEKYSVRGRAEKKAKKILKKIGNIKISNLLKK